MVAVIAAFFVMAQNIQAAPNIQKIPNIQAAPNSKMLKDIQHKITTTRGRARKYEQAARTLGQKITGLRQNLVVAARKIQQAEQAVYLKETRLDRLDNQKKNLETTLKSRYGEMARTLAAMQRLSQQPAELVTFRPATAINSLRSASLLKTLQPELKKRAGIIRQDITALGLVRQKIIQDRQQLKNLLAALTAKQITMNQLLDARRLKQRALHQATREQRRKLKQFAAKAKNLQDLIARIDRENKARAIERAAREAARRLMAKPGRAAGGIDNSRQQASLGTSDRRRLGSLRQRGSDFRISKGSMPLPARGRIAQRFGTRTAEGQMSEGITIHTLPQATVVSPYEGRIVFAGRFRSYGLLLIISHGPEYHTLLAGMTRLDAEVGQWVLKGEPVGQMAAASAKSTGANRKLTVGTNSGQTLYVELRRMGKPINPLPWIMAADRKVL